MPWLLLADSCQVKYKHNEQGCTKDSPILIDWLILSCETHHSAMGWTLIIASFKAQSIRMLAVQWNSQWKQLWRKSAEQIKRFHIH